MSGLHEEHIKGEIFIKRIFVFLFLQIFLIVILVLRLINLQIFSFDYFSGRSDNNRIKIQIIPPLRGNILDRNGFSLTKNTNSYELLLYQNVKNRDSVDSIYDILKINEEQKNKIEQMLLKNKYRTVVTLLNNINWDSLVKLQNNLYKLDGISIEEGYIREYLYDEMFSHIIGYVANPNEDEIKILSKKHKKEFLMHPSYKIGKSGLEKKFNEQLIGEFGYKKSEVNVLGVPIDNLELQKPKKAKDLQLTIDLELQQYIYELVKDKRASVVVLDVETGEILAMISTPAFKSNEFVNGVSTEYWAQLNKDEQKPLMNKSLSALYPPGSTFKPIVAIAGLMSNWNPASKILCSGKTMFGPREFRCWKKEGHSHLNIEEAIQHSCNIFFANLSIYTGIDVISDYGSKFGLGEVFDIGIEGFQKGIMPSREWKAKVLNDVWVRGDTINTGIGQGFMLANPLQLAVMISRIANNGYPIKPFLMYNSKMREKNQKLFQQKAIASKEIMDSVKKSLFMVVNKSGGTAFGKRIKTKGFEMAGKTGTAQVISLDRKLQMEENNKEIQEKYKNHGLFVGFAPFDKPKYGIAVLIEHGGGGSSSAAPIAKSILEFAQDKKIANY